MIRKILIGLGIGVLCSILYYTISPLFRTVAVYDDAPVSLKNESGGENEDVTVSYPVIDTLAHPASGTLRVIEENGKMYVRYENYKTINGPDLFVYLAKDLDAKEYVNLGEIRGTEGNINYEIPADVSLEEYRYVLTWCKQFGVLFNYVDIGEVSPAIESELIEDEGVTRESDNVETAPQKAIMGTGCFWCVEHDFEKVKGVIDVVSGYAGGTTENPTYENYAEGGHREVVLVTYDPAVVSYGNLVEHTIKYGDPTDAGGSFYDRGEEYAPAIYYETEEERVLAEDVIRQIDEMGVYEKPLAFKVLPRPAFFYPAEEYHQDYAKKIRFGIVTIVTARDEVHL